MRKPLIVGAALAVSLGSVACTKKEEPAAPAATTAAPAGSSTTAAPATSSPGTTEKKGLKKADLIKKADAICKTYSDKQDKMDKPSSDATEAEERSYLEDVLQLGKDQLKELEELGAPTEDKDQWEEGLAKNKATMDRLEELLADDSKTPTEIANDSQIEELIDEGKKLGKEFGLKDCAGGSSSSGTTTSSKKSTTTSGKTGTTYDEYGSTISKADFIAAIVRQGLSEEIATCVVTELEKQGVPLKPDAALTPEESAAHRAAGELCARQSLSG